MKPCASNLNSNDVFVLKSPDSLFVWRGVGASEEEVKGAKFVVSFLGGKPTDVTEGKEPGQDWLCILYYKNPPFGFHAHKKKKRKKNKLPIDFHCK